MIKCGFYVLWSFPANWDMCTWINFQDRLQRLHMLWWWKNSCLYSEGLSASDQDEARCVTWILKCMILRSESPNFIQNYTLLLYPILSQPILNSLWISKRYYHLTYCTMSGETSNPWICHYLPTKFLFCNH